MPHRNITHVRVDEVQVEFKEWVEPPLVASYLQFHETLRDSSILEEGKTYKFRVIPAEGVERFYLELLSKPDKYMKTRQFKTTDPDRPEFWEDLQEFYDDEELRSPFEMRAAPMVGHLYAYNDPETELWERIYVTKFWDGRLKVTAVEVDTLLVKVIPYEDGRVFELAAMFTRIPAFPATLADVLPLGGTEYTWTEEADKRFEKLVIGKEVYAKIVKKTSLDRYSARRAVPAHWLTVVMFLAEDSEEEGKPEGVDKKKEVEEKPTSDPEPEPSSSKEGYSWPKGGYRLGSSSPKKVVVDSEEPKAEGVDPPAKIKEVTIAPTCPQWLLERIKRAAEIDKPRDSIQTILCNEGFAQWNDNVEAENHVWGVVKKEVHLLAD